MLGLILLLVFVGSFALLIKCFKMQERQESEKAKIYVDAQKRMESELEYFRNNIVLVDIKTGEAALNARQRQVKNIVGEKKIRFETFRPEIQ
jgi:predicted Holliday junction resolvase-like endonuclease